MKLLIAGDSFAADWTVKYRDQKGWPNLLAEQFCVKNIAQAGVSEYKIYQQIMSLGANALDSYDFFIVSHTSPYRVITRTHPIHSNDLLHKNADLLLSDIEYHSNTFKGLFNSSLRAARSYMKYHYDVEYYEVTYKLLRDAINRYLPQKKTIALCGFSITEQFDELNFLDLSNIFAKEPGLMNHLSVAGNIEIYTQLLDRINKHDRYSNNLGIEYNK